METCRTAKPVFYPSPDWTNRQIRTYKLSFSTSNPFHMRYTHLLLHSPYHSSTHSYFHGQTSITFPDSDFSNLCPHMRPANLEFTLTRIPYIFQLFFRVFASSSFVASLNVLYLLRACPVVDLCLKSFFDNYI
ncbi:hypothetical protein ABW19_dt0209208 [Dactylella cylindrospora]|nr:hypothetical protein ABW19_dt0209208 [Dactylella cylindrospora]